MEKPRKQKQKKESKSSGLEKYGRYSGIAFQMIAIILLFVWVGLKLDEKAHRGEPLFVIIFSIVGVFLALYVVLKDFVKFK